MPFLLCLYISLWRSYFISRIFQVFIVLFQWSVYSLFVDATNDSHYFPPVTNANWFTIHTPHTTHHRIQQNPWIIKMSDLLLWKLVFYFSFFCCCLSVSLEFAALFQSHQAVWTQENVGTSHYPKALLHNVFISFSYFASISLPEWELFFVQISWWKVDACEIMVFSSCCQEISTSHIQQLWSLIKFYILSAALTWLLYARTTSTQTLSNTFQNKKINPHVFFSVPLSTSFLPSLFTTIEWKLLYSNQFQFGNIIIFYAISNYGIPKTEMGIWFWSFPYFYSHRNDTYGALLMRMNKSCWSACGMI